MLTEMNRDVNTCREKSKVSAELEVEAFQMRPHLRQATSSLARSLPAQKPFQNTVSEPAKVVSSSPLSQLGRLRAQIATHRNLDLAIKLFFEPDSLGDSLSEGRSALSLQKAFAPSNRPLQARQAHPICRLPRFPLGSARFDCRTSE